MANRRMLSSNMFSDDVFMELDDLTRLVWIGLIVMSADDQGRLQDNAMLIKSQVFPMDNKASADVESALYTLEQNKMIQRYQKDGKCLIQIVNWWKHQTPSWASPSNYPAPDGWVDREKYHAAGNKVATTNWDTQGGFNNLHSALHSQLPTGVSRLIEERRGDKSTSDVKSESEYTDESESNTPDGGTCPSSNDQRVVSICDHLKTAGMEITNDTKLNIKALISVFKVPDIHDAIDHMKAHTDRPNLGYLKKVLDGWFAERKIEKVYS